MLPNIFNVLRRDFISDIFNAEKIARLTAPRASFWDVVREPGAETFKIIHRTATLARARKHHRRRPERKYFKLRAIGEKIVRDAEQRIVDMIAATSRDWVTR